MLFWSPPRRTEIVHRTKAPVVPSTPIDAPSAAIRNPGLASATTKPSHQVIALRSCLSSTSACAIKPSSPSSSQPPAAYQLVQAPLYHASRTHVNMPQLVNRDADLSNLSASQTRGRPVVLATMSVRVDPSAERMAI